MLAASFVSMRRSREIRGAVEAALAGLSALNLTALVHHTPLTAGQDTSIENSLLSIKNVRRKLNSTPSSLGGPARITPPAVFSMSGAATLFRKCRHIAGSADNLTQFAKRAKLRF